MIDHQVPFFSNLPDNTHCFQAVLKMLANYFWPAQNYSFNQLDKITAKAEDKWTWPFAGFLWLCGRGLDIVDIGLFDMKRFSQEGEKYLIEYCGPKVAKSQIEHTGNLIDEQKLSGQFAHQINTSLRIATIDDIKKYLDQDYLIIINLNQKILNQIPGYTGHFVLIKGYKDFHLILHDPGLPFFKNRHVDYETFSKAWGYPDQNQQGLTAFRQKKS